MKRTTVKNFISVFLLTYLIFTALTALSNAVFGAHLSASVNPVLGIAFGWPAVLACTLGNFTCDWISGRFLTACLGVLPNLLYGALPYYVWQRLSRSRSHRTRLDSPSKTLAFSLLMLGNAALKGLAVGAIQFLACDLNFWNEAWPSFLNHFDISLMFGLPLMVAFDYVYSRFQHHRRRCLSMNEIVILWMCATEMAAVAVVVCVCRLVLTTMGTAFWKSVFLFGAYAANGVMLAFVLVMVVLSHRKKKNSGLRIFQRRSGTVFVDEKRRLEFVSYAGRHPMDTEASQDGASFEDAWYTVLSNQKGCLMKCSFCDCPAYGFYGNVTLDDLRYQMDVLLDNSGSTQTRWFGVDFMRMGEPVFNPDILTYLETVMPNQIRAKVDADVIYPTLSTMMPRSAKDLDAFLQSYCRIKNEVYDGNADLVLSINTTDEAERKRLFANQALSLEEISRMTASLPMPKGKKYRLSFAVGADTSVDADLLDALFEKAKFAVSLTPIHATFNAADNGYASQTQGQTVDAVAQTLSAHGWDVTVCADQAQDRDGLTGGNLLLANIPDKITDKVSEKKRIGILVAIELKAIFDRYPNWKELDGPPGFKLFSVEKEKYTIYILQCGMGEVAASAGVQYLISQFRVAMVINFGVVGGMTGDMQKQKVCLVNRVVHYKYDCSEFLPLRVGQVDGHRSLFLKPDETLIKNALLVMEESLPLVTCCSGDKFIGTAEEKTYLHDTFEGDICDMESAGIVLTCEANRTPCILFKAVADGLNDGAAGFFAELESASDRCLEIADKIMEKIALMES